MLSRLEPSGWMDGARRFSGSLRGAGHEPGRLLVVGTPQQEPWHLTAHLADAARHAGAPELAPVLVRWHVPAGAPPHLAVGIDAVQQARARSTLLVASPCGADEDLLERLADARRRGAVLLAMHDGDEALAGLVHDQLGTPHELGIGFEAVTHVVATPDLARGRRRWPRG